MRRAPFQPFPQTRTSFVAGVAADDESERTRAFGAVVDAYWRPVYTHLRLRWHADDEEARDLTQEFFARAFEKRYFAAYDPSRARFRTFVRLCLDRFAANAREAATRTKRGGAVVHVPIVAEDGGAIDLPSADESPDERFRREWVRSLFALAVEDVRAWAEASDKGATFAVFERYDLADDDERPTYAALATELGIPATQVTNRLAAARRELRRAVLARLRETCGGEDEYRAEARSLLGVEIA